MTQSDKSKPCIVAIEWRAARFSGDSCYGSCKNAPGAATVAGDSLVRQNIAGAQKAGFNDANWATVSTPHTFNDVDSYDHIISHSGGDRRPTAEKRVDFRLSGPAIWRGGYDSGIVNSVDKLHLDAECGVNRVAIRSTLQPGDITLTATAPGLTPATVHIASRPVKIIDGLELQMPQRLSRAAGAILVRGTLEH